MENAPLPTENPEYFKLEPFNHGELLRGLFLYQEALINKYIILGRLPERPLVFNERAAQKFLRLTISNLIEEIGEASLEYGKTDAWLKENVWDDPEAKVELQGILDAYMEELADSLHFFIEVLIYAGLDYSDIQSFTELSTKPLGIYVAEPLGDSFSISRHYNIHNEDARIAAFNAYRWNTEKVYPRVGIELITQTQLREWETVKFLLAAKNLLKGAKEWRTEEVTANLNQFQQLLITSFVNFISVVDLTNVDAITLYEAYEKKNLINQKRLIANY